MFTDTPAIPQEDPSVKALRDAEEQRAERDRIRSTQDQLEQETRLRSDNTGVRSLLGTYRGLTSMLGSS